ncbi:hypothetical protein [Ruegeria sp. Ofav3-42]|uniref:hypothetical protein n=1 Tax=Ruegeria sp. Ofav3-42 TaxID=2917759 RepID=UPI001EF5B5AF|nr:hypothetical protein [Ruegeria sp. Ofav3-42]MCG7521422.1 hypothetical protein [Ruegeria sp. Ofav3-42]
MSKDAVLPAMEVMQRHVEALNARDPKAIAETLHFPHYRLAGETVKIWETPDSYLSDFHARAGEDWGHTEWGHLNVLQSDENKVHLDVMVDRFDKAGQPLVSFRSLWVVTRINGVWAAQMRSSFAQDPR